MSSLLSAAVLIVCHDLPMLVCVFVTVSNLSFNSTKQLQRASLDNQANLKSTVVSYVKL
jgi:hypothetical protein